MSFNSIRTKLCVCAVFMLILIGCTPSAPQNAGIVSQPFTDGDERAALNEASAASDNYLPIIMDDDAATATPVPTATPVVTATPIPSTSDWSDAWMVNTTSETSVVFDGIGVNVASVYTTTVNGADYQCITSAGIPNYQKTITQADIDELVNRPKGNEFNGSSTPSVSVGDVIDFGEPVGYTPGGGCTDVGGGYGYWPAGPACPSDQAKDWCFPLDPEPAAADADLCETDLNQIGIWVNGVSIFNWEDGASYNNANVWQNDALNLERYDLDVCVGHSANGHYHHHSNPTCLQEQLNDTGAGESPIYGFSADGYPIYGPWESAGTLANSCWKTRDYSAGSATGCGVDGERSCLLVDQYDITQGTTAAASDGPTTSDTVTSMSGNTIPTVSGAYFQDYYYDPTCTAQGDNYLDEHNGHDIGDGRGYHYHATLSDNGDGTYEYAFPHYNGPAYAGVLSDDNSIAQCGGDGGTMPPPGGGGGGPGGGGGGGGQP